MLTLIVNSINNLKKPLNIIGLLALIFVAGCENTSTSQQTFEDHPESFQEQLDQVKKAWSNSNGQDSSNLKSPNPPVYVDEISTMADDYLKDFLDENRHHQDITLQLIKSSADCDSLYEDYVHDFRKLIRAMEREENYEHLENMFNLYLTRFSEFNCSALNQRELAYADPVLRKRILENQEIERKKADDDRKNAAFDKWYSFPSNCKIAECANHRSKAFKNFSDLWDKGLVDFNGTKVEIKSAN